MAVPKDHLRRFHGMDDAKRDMQPSRHVWCFKGSKEGSRQEASRGQDFKPVRTEKEALMTIDEGQINWVEQTADEELNHALMAFTVNNEIFRCGVLSKYKTQPQSPSPTVSNASSIIFSICPSNDSDGELGAVSDASSTHYSTCQSNDSDGARNCN
ncbi:hypothetical protein Tco_1177028 [Tanacetum coccineum]